MTSAHPKVLISNVNRLHAHHHAYGLQRAGMLQLFVTSIWCKPDRLPYRLAGSLPGPIGRAARSFLAKRSHPGLQGDLVEQHWGQELVRILADVLTLGYFHNLIEFLHRGAYDRGVARRVVALKPDVVVGYEISCARTFESAKHIGATTVLDHASFEHSFSESRLRASTSYLFRDWIAARLAKRKLQELERADFIFCVSELAKKSMVDSGIKSDRINVIRLGTDLATFTPNPKGVANRPFRFVYAGSLSIRKGTDILIRAFAGIGLRDAELILIGSVADVNPHDFNIAGCRHVNYLTATQLAEQYRNSDVFVLPSLIDSWGMVVPEAMACGVPAIVTATSGSCELIDETCGWVIPPGNMQALQEAMITAYNKRAELPQMGTAAANRMAGQTWEKYGDEIVRLMTLVSRRLHDEKSAAENKTDLIER